jgi:hypothetical protein
MATINAVLEEYAGMSVFLENLALITNPTMRYKVITNGFKDLEDLAKKKSEHAKLACNVIRKSTGTVQTKDISTDQEECSTPFSAAFLEYRLVLNKCLMGLTMSWDSLA